MEINTGTVVGDYKEIQKNFPESVILLCYKETYYVIGEKARKIGALLNFRPMLSRKKQVEFICFPYHWLDIALPRIIRGGCRVAIVEENKNCMNEITFE